MKNELKRGLLIAFEGLDRSGKSTQSQKLVSSLISKNFDAKLMRFPGIFSPKIN